MEYPEVAPALIAVFALVFAVFSFWWLNAKPASLSSLSPLVYAFVEGFRLRFPVTVFNKGAVPGIVRDLRIVISGVGTYEWQTTRSSLKPKPDDGHDFAVPIAVGGRSTVTVIAEFGGDYEWLPKAGEPYKIRLEGMVGSRTMWEELTTFTWWSPPSAEAMTHYISHRNEHCD